MGKVINFFDEVHKRLLQKLEKTYDPLDQDVFVKLVNELQNQKKRKKET